MGVLKTMKAPPFVVLEMKQGVENYEEDVEKSSFLKSAPNKTNTYTNTNKI